MFLLFSNERTRFFLKRLEGTGRQERKKCTSETEMYKTFNSLRELLDRMFVVAPGKKISINRKLLKDLASAAWKCSRYCPLVL